MNVVSLDYDKCTGCGLCIQASARCFLKTGEKVSPQVDEKTCVLCGRCVAVCPSGAITHHAMDMGNFPEVGGGQLVRTDDFIRFIRERRSHRAFLNRPVPREHMDRLIDTVRYAPTGHNDPDVEIVLVTNPERRKKLSDLTVDFMSIGEKKMAAKLAKLEAGGTGTPEEMAELGGTIEFCRMLMQARDSGLDPIFYEAPMVAIFHSRMRSTVTPKDNCVIAATTMGLTARTMGLETTFIALFVNAFRGHEPVRDALGLPEGHEVLSTLVIGYPKLKFLRAVDRKPIKTRWDE
jgi:nitroreductase/NAD-dependent dihydropyrimidine dehydrogenase PreA subunit